MSSERPRRSGQCQANLTQAPLHIKRGQLGVQAVLFITSLGAGALALSYGHPQDHSAGAPAETTRSSSAAFAAACGAATPIDAASESAAVNGDDAQLTTRAAVRLGRSALSGDSTAAAILLDALEQRRPQASRDNVGRDVVAAASLAGVARSDRVIRQALIALASGPNPHPSLATRVECARTAALAGAPFDVGPFLLAVLRAETPDQVKSPRTWDRVQTLAWVKTRAASALALATGQAATFRPDGSWAHQMAVADRLEAALAKMAPK